MCVRTFLQLPGYLQVLVVPRAAAGRIRETANVFLPAIRMCADRSRMTVSIL